MHLPPCLPHGEGCPGLMWALLSRSLKLLHDFLCFPWLAAGGTAQNSHFHSISMKGEDEKGHAITWQIQPLLVIDISARQKPFFTSSTVQWIMKYFSLFHPLTSPHFLVIFLANVIGDMFSFHEYCKELAQHHCAPHLKQGGQRMLPGFPH